MSRADGRTNEEFRPAFVKCKVLSQARGSCYAEFDKTKVMVGVFGPRPTELKHGFSDMGRLACEVKLTTFAAGSYTKAEQASVERAYADALCQALSPSVQLHLFPKAALDVTAMVLQSGGADLAALTTAASLALADAGVELYDLAPTVQLSKHGSQLLLDPSWSESACEDAGLTVTLLPSSQEVTALAMSGAWGQAEVHAGLELALGACSQLKATMRDTLLAQYAAAAEAD